ncbi:MAG: glycosyltransferase family 4 protein [Actinomycetota bacterium]
MRIGVNLLFLVPNEGGGSETLLTKLIPALGPHGDDIVVFGLRGLSAVHPQLRQATTVVEAPWSSARPALRIAAEHSWLALEAARRKLDVIHHAVGAAPFLKLLPTVTTIHDVQYRHHPENFVRLKRAWLRGCVPQTARRSEVVCVPSRFVAEDVVAAFSLDSGKVLVVPFGSEGLFASEPTEGGEVRSRYRLDRPFFLFPGRTYPHKNHRLLIRAYAPLAHEADLVLTGAPWFRDREVEAAARNLGLTGKVRHLGLVPRADLAGLYREAVACVFPSRFEGFGAPALEAMTLSCPLIAANAAALPEVVGEAGILLEPDDLEGWSETMANLLHRPELADQLARRGKARAALFSWERAAGLQREAYLQAVGG